MSTARVRVVHVECQSLRRYVKQGLDVASEKPEALLESNWSPKNRGQSTTAAAMKSPQLFENFGRAAGI